MAFLQPGLRGGTVLINDGYRYQKNRVRGDKMFWRCWRTTCRVTLQTSLFNPRDPDPDQDPEIAVLQVSVEAKRLSDEWATLFTAIVMITEPRGLRSISTALALVEEFLVGKLERLF